MTYFRNLFLPGIAFFCSCFLINVAQADTTIYKCSDPDGRIRFTDKARPDCKALDFPKVSKREGPKPRSKRGVIKIGMLGEAAIAAWGKPLSVHRTTTAKGLSEQWVYGDRNYLYFQDGLLTAIED